ncbi:aldo/keto reductase [Caldicellulosiruptor kronotskyensis 2002]|uniref:Aldo/keto reductase n=1 Tax=Caldicellulosiruptor kronotskyensis (strain DSM 18902 / VKM B-2412 / 2002) TaxID=632348 RepID=E4SD68_CALK2|nr:aldo/keto reductase [Caldicellulosiruptor kronotskyensis]ADQ45132.1 aldo/keto reductase [Caldicellulosiruptor kronotskyensis 2002]
MKYRKFPNIDFEVSALGFGCMRLPILGDDASQINQPLAIEMIRYAIDNGVNYIDTAYGYHGGNSEVVVGKALKEGYRNKVKLATKLPVWKLTKIEDADMILDEQLKRLDTDYIDFYLLHALNKQRWDMLKSMDIFSWIEKVKSKGKIKHIGFSFHDSLDTFKTIIDEYDGWEFCQVQYNYLNRNYQAGEEGLKYAHAKGLGVIIMEPLLGGKLARKPPEQVQIVWEKTKVKRTPAQWGLLWLWNQKEVTTVLSGMSSMQQVIENIKTADEGYVGCLSEDELKLIDEVTQKYLELKPIDCTGCKYCLPCPNGVDIPRNFNLYNDAKVYNMYEETKKAYLKPEKVEQKASNCVECSLCEEKCPQNLPIRKLLKEVAQFFEG